MKNRAMSNLRGQSTLEFTVVIVCVLAALLAMRVYIKRGVQGKLRSAADSIGQQYDPGNTTSDMTIELHSDVTTKVETTEEEEKQKTTTTVITNSSEERRHGTETVGELDSPLF